MKNHFYIPLVILSAVLNAAPIQQSDSVNLRDDVVRTGQWDRLMAQRPLLAWETLRGYRLFFHPEDSESQRRWLGVGVSKKGGDLTSVWALLRPYQEAASQDSWLRLEGVYSNRRDWAALEWDGSYRNLEFPDLRYRFDIEARYGERKNAWKVVAVKSKDHPRFHKIGEDEVTNNPLKWNTDTGEYLAQSEKIFLSASQTKQIPILARVYLPELEDVFKIDGVLVQARRLDGPTDLSPIEAEQWDCVCAQFIPEDSPARKKLKSVRCWWELPQDAKKAVGLWELRLALFHNITHANQIGACDLPVLDEDRVLVRVRP